MNTDRHKREIAKRRKVKALLLARCKTDSEGRRLCPLCGRLPDWRGLSLMHIKPLSLGGKTTLKNCRVGCYPCHNGIEGHRIENMPHSQPVDKPLMLSGYHGATGKPFTREMQAGIRPKAH